MAQFQSPALAVLAILVLVGVVALRLRPRLMARGRRAAPVGAVRSSAAPAAPVGSGFATPAVDERAGLTARAFPVYGLPSGRETAAPLERMLGRLDGVTAVYVSPVTAFAYVDFRTAEVTEEQIAQAIRHGGYEVGAAERRFDWRQIASTT